MKKIAFLSLPFALALAAGCSLIEQDIPEMPAEDQEILISKSFQAGVVETRTTLDGVTVLFAKDESISIWDGSGNREYKADEAGSNVSFSGEVSASATEFFALSPYSASTVFTKSGNMVTAKTSLPSTQEAVPGTFASGMNISAAKSDSDDSFALENVLGVAKFTLASANLGGHQIASIELSSAYPLAGDVVVTYGETATAAAGTSTVNTVTLAHADGSALIDGTYYMTLLPNAGGQITLKFTATDGYTATKTATLKSAFEAGSIKNLGTVKGLNWVGPKYVKVTSTQADWTGDYLLVYEAEPYVLTGVDNSLGIVGDVVIGSDQTISWEDYKAYNISVEKNGNGYSLYLNGVGYLGAKNGNNLLSSNSVSSDAYRWSISVDSEGDTYITHLSYNDRSILCNPSSTRFCAYKETSMENGFVKAVQFYKKSAGSGSTVSGPTVTVTTGDATDITNASATLNATYEGLNPINVQEVGFHWGTDASNLTETVYDNSAFTASSGTISASLGSLSPSTTYYYQVTMMVWDEARRTYVEFKGGIKSFRTGGVAPVTKWKGWLELPANTLTASNYIYDEQMVDTERNYTMSYDISSYTAMWVAYPLYSATIGQGSTWSRPSNWSYNGHTTKSYGVNWTEDYGNELYARGHQIPNADRNNRNVSSDFQGQTFLLTNSTPQIQNRFNGSIWSRLENGVRSVALQTDTVYVVTGPVFQKVGETKTIKYINPQLDPDKEVPVPNYYWKALLKVKWSGDTVTSASAIGFWYEHKSYVNDENYDDSQFIVSVKDIEDWTGLDLFANLPGDKDNGIEKIAQENKNWSTFKSF